MLVSNNLLKQNTIKTNENSNNILTISNNKNNRQSIPLTSSLEQNNPTNLTHLRAPIITRRLTSGKHSTVNLKQTININNNTIFVNNNIQNVNSRAIIKNKGITPQKIFSFRGVNDG